MTNKFTLFIANWKMFGDINSLKSLNKVIKFCNIYKKNKFKLIYCPPYTLLNLFSKKLQNTKIMLGAQNCHYEQIKSAYTGSISIKMIKKLGAKYVIVGHSEVRATGETDLLINKKIKALVDNKVKIIFCIGETLSQRKKNHTYRILINQIKKGLKGIKKRNDIFVAYEPIWSIGTGVIPKISDLDKDINYLKNFLLKKIKIKNPKVLYGGSVNNKNIADLKKINAIDGFLIGGVSHKANKFIDIIKKTFI